MKDKIIPIKFDKRKKSLGKDDFLGLYLPPKIAKILKLQSIADKTSLSCLVRRILIKWIDEHKITEEKTIICIMKQMQIEWNYIKNKNKISYSEFKEQLFEELKDKKIDAITIDRIIKQVKR